MSEKSEYFKFVDYPKVENWRSGDMKGFAVATSSLPSSRSIVVNPSGSWSHVNFPDVSFRMVTEGPGHKPWLAEWWYQETGHPYFDVVAWDTGLAAINDLISTGHMPIIFTDDITVHDYAWFSDPVSRESLNKGFGELCEKHGMAITGGETASLPFLMNPRAPLKDSLSLSASVVGILNPSRREIENRVGPGDRILGSPSSGAHVNGYSMIIDRGMELSKKFLTILKNGSMLGQEAMKPTVSYAKLVEALMYEKVTIKGLLPSTGDGLRKLLRMGEFTFNIDKWVEVPEIFRFMRSLGVTQTDCLTTFNWGIGYYFFVPKSEAPQAIVVAAAAGYPLFDLGFVEEGPPQVNFEPEGIALSPRKDE